MIKFEENMLVLDSTLSKDDHKAILEFIDTVKKEERDAIVSWVKENSSYVEFDAGDGVVRDHFTSIDLINFIKSRR